MTLSDKTICVAGASGLAGSNIVKAALDRGYTVRGTMRNKAAPDKAPYLKALCVASDRVQRTAPPLPAVVTLSVSRMMRLRWRTSVTVRGRRSEARSIVSIAVENNARSRIPASPRLASSALIRFTFDGVNGSRGPTSMPLFREFRFCCFLLPAAACQACRA